jgi:hypothetical protein
MEFFTFFQVYNMHLHSKSPADWQSISWKSYVAEALQNNTLSCAAGTNTYSANAELISPSFCHLTILTLAGVLNTDRTTSPGINGEKISGRWKGHTSLLLLPQVNSLAGAFIKWVTDNGAEYSANHGEMHRPSILPTVNPANTVNGLDYKYYRAPGFTTGV